MVLISDSVNVFSRTVKLKTPFVFLATVSSSASAAVKVEPRSKATPASVSALSTSSHADDRGELRLTQETSMTCKSADPSSLAPVYQNLLQTK